jgi:hypothetical protein
VVEPTARVTRLFANGQSLSAQLGIDVITGASPSGAMPAGRIQTTTTPSGNLKTLPAGQIPTAAFSDKRFALDAEWQAPLGGVFGSTFGGHYSKEKDYRSLGATAQVSADVFRKLTQVTVGAGFNRDEVFPVGGTTAGLAGESEIVSTSPQAKRVASALVGINQVLTRRWMLGVNVSRMRESGYLTEPYKVVSLIDPATGQTSGALTEKRPDTRQRTDVLGSSVYHLSRDVFYSSYRYYWDDWGVRSHTADFKYRRELGDAAGLHLAETFLQPHVRWYSQSAARFFRYGLIDRAALPEFATSDYRLGALRTLTLGATFGFRPFEWPGEWTLRGEYLRQWGDGHPAGAVGLQRGYDLFPAVDIGTLLVGYSIAF